MLSDSETTCLQFAEALFLAFMLNANKVLQSYARKFRVPTLTCAQDDNNL
jgi:hypothetical protein